MCVCNNIDIKYCHRHLIENFGSNSLIGNWVSRILRTNTKEEFEIISKIIKAEIDIYLQNININEQNSKAIEKFQKLNILLGFQKQNNDKILKNGQDGYAMVAPQLQIQLNLFIIILIVIFLIKAHLYQDYKMLKMFYLKNLIQESNGMEIIITNTSKKLENIQQ